MSTLGIAIFIVVKVYFMHVCEWIYVGKITQLSYDLRLITPGLQASSSIIISGSGSGKYVVGKLQQVVESPFVMHLKHCVL